MIKTISQHGPDYASSDTLSDTPHHPHAPSHAPSHTDIDIDDDAGGGERNSITATEDGNKKGIERIEERIYLSDSKADLSDSKADLSNSTSNMNDVSLFSPHTILYTVSSNASETFKIKTRIRPKKKRLFMEVYMHE